MFGSLMRDMERDPIFGGHSRMMNMNRMMNSFFGDNNAFGGFGGFPMMPFGPPVAQRPMFGMDPFGGGFPHMGMTNDLSLANHHQFGGGPSFSSMSVMSMQSDGSGAPLVYHASSSTRQGPGGVKETRKTVCDSRSGLKKMSVGRHLGDRGHVVEREENLWTGQREENEELLNLDFEEKPHFDREWRNRAHGGVAAATDPYGRRSITGPNVGGGRSSAGRNATYTPGVTIEEVDDDEEIPSQPEPMRALPPIPTVSSSSPSHHHHHRRPKDRRQPRISKNRSKKL